VTLHEFRSLLPAYLHSVQSIYDEGGIRGPFALTLAVRDLQRSEKIRWAFRSVDRISLPRAAIVERIDDEDTVSRFCEMVLNASVYR